jgi:hypothetical protein
MLRNTFGPDSDKVTGEWRSLRNEEHHDLFFFSYIIWVITRRRMRWGRNVASIGKSRGAYRVSRGEN